MLKSDVLVHSVRVVHECVHVSEGCKSSWLRLTFFFSSQMTLPDFSLKVTLECREQLVNACSRILNCVTLHMCRCGQYIIYSPSSCTERLSSVVTVGPWIERSSKWLYDFFWCWWLCVYIWHWWSCLHDDHIFCLLSSLQHDCKVSSSGSVCTLQNEDLQFIRKPSLLMRFPMRFPMLLRFNFRETRTCGGINGCNFGLTRIANWNSRRYEFSVFWNTSIWISIDHIDLLVSLPLLVTAVMDVIIWKWSLKYTTSVLELILENLKICVQSHFWMSRFISSRC